MGGECGGYQDLKQVKPVAVLADNYGSIMESKASDAAHPQRDTSVQAQAHDNARKQSAHTRWDGVVRFTKCRQAGGASQVWREG